MKRLNGLWFKGSVAPFVSAFEVFDSASAFSDRMQSLRKLQFAFYNMTSDRNSLEICLNTDPEFLREVLVFAKAQLSEADASPFLEGASTGVVSTSATKIHCLGF